MSSPARQVSLATILAELAELPPTARFIYPIRHGTMRAGAYAPSGIDDQTPHDQDELYLIASGSGTFVLGGERMAFAPSDLLFVRAGEEHRFVDFTPDFVTWVIFWGAKGGE